MFLKKGLLQGSTYHGADGGGAAAGGVWFGTGQPRICQRRKKKEREILRKKRRCREEMSKARADLVQRRARQDWPPKGPLF